MPNLIYNLRGTAQVWTPSPTGAELALGLTSLANGVVRAGARWDRGALAAPERYIWRLWTQAGTTPALGAIVTLFLATSDGTHGDGTIATTDGTIAVDKLRNLVPIGAVEIDQAATGVEFCNSDAVVLFERYVQPVVFNEFGVALSATNSHHGFSLTPASLQIQ